MRRFTERKIFRYALLALILVVFAGLSLARMQQVVAGDDLCLLLAAKSLYASSSPHPIDRAVPPTVSDHPYLYVNLLAWSFKLFGPTAFAARLVGLMSGLLSIILVFAIVRRAARGNETARLSLAAAASALYALAPTTIQNTVIIHIDNTILIPAALFTFWGIARYLEDRKDAWLWCIACGIMFSLWARVSTPLFFIPVIISSLFLMKGARPARRAVTISILCGAAIFLISWFAYAKVSGVDFARPFAYTFLRSSAESGLISPSSLAQNILYLVLWIGLFPLLAIIWVALKELPHFREEPRTAAHLVFFCGGALAIFYTVFGGASFGYIRYLSPAIPLLYAGTALLVAPRNAESPGIKRVLVLIALAAALIVFISGDMLYIVRYVLRGYQAFALPSALLALKIAALRGAAASLAFIALIAFSLKRLPATAAPRIFIALSAGSIIAATAIQSAAPYNTGFNYGETGMADAASYILSCTRPGSAVIGPKELVYRMKTPGASYPRDSFWSDTAALKKALSDRKTSAFAYSVATNTVDQIRTIITDKAVGDLLRRDYRHRRIGSYEIWLRK